MTQNIRKLLATTSLSIIALLAACAVQGQTFTNLYSFSTTNTAPSYPYSGLTLSGGKFYGCTERTSGNLMGGIFSVNTDGTGFTNLHAFTGGNDGDSPESTLTVSGNKIYGTTYNGGANGYGVVFSVNTDGTGFTTLYSFQGNDIFGGGNDGGNPIEGVALLGKTLYGVTSTGGTDYEGTLYCINIDGSGYATLHNFTGGSDGASPWAKLIAVDNTLYGLAYQGGTYGYGTIFAINSDGTGFTNLYSFNSSTDGANPRSALLAIGNKLYGTAGGGGAHGAGTVFCVNMDGTGFQVLHAFVASSDGSLPWSQLTVAGSTLYGTANSSGANGFGTLFSLNLNGTGFTKLYDFANNTNSIAFPQAGVQLLGNTLIGTAVWAGKNGGGGLYAFTLPAPVLNISSVGQQSLVYWPNSAVNYTLQSTADLVSSNWTNVTNDTPVTAVLVTNSLPSQYFHLQLNN